jgi:hypothetical protein
MKSLTRGTGVFFILALTLAVLMIAGCEDEPTQPEPPEAPEIPPLSTFLMDFDDFSDTDTMFVAPKETRSRTALVSQDNWGWAALNVGVWNLIITMGMVIPVATFAESFNHEPVRQANGSWLWSYDVTVASVEHTAKLYGSIDNDGTDWEMYVSKQGSYEDFLWYSGEADLFLTEGTWTLNKHPEEPIPFIFIEWHRNPQDATSDIKYTNIIPEGAENGGYIFFGTTTDTTHDAFYDIYNKGHDNHTNIEWNRTAKDGQVKDPDHFGDEVWHCWDSDLEDIECP